MQSRAVMDTCEDEEADLTRTARWRRFADEANLGSPPEGYYARLVQAAPAADRTAKQVEKDLHRTFGSLQRPGLRALRVPTPEAMKSLRNVLLAYAQHNPQVGYCQSMNFLVAILLLVVDEEYSFWCLAAIVERLMPGHFSQCMEMALVDQGVLAHFLRVEDPLLVSHLEQLHVAPSLVTTQWLLTCFVGSALSLRALLRVWDRLFNERHVACLFRIAASLLISSRRSLLQTVETGAAYQALSQLGHDISDPAAIHALFATAAALRHPELLEHESIAALRHTHAASLREERGVGASEQAVAAVAVATATAAEMIAQVQVEEEEGVEATSGSHHCGGSGTGLRRQRSRSSSARRERANAPAGTLASGAALTAARAESAADPEWTVVPAEALGTEPMGAAEGWSLVERAPAPSRTCYTGSALSYVIMQLEAPRLLEAHFASAAGGSADLAALVAVKHLSAQLEALA